MRHFEKPCFPFFEPQKLELIYDTVDVCNFVINEFNPMFEVQNMGNVTFQNALFGNEALSYSCLWAKSNAMTFVCKYVSYYMIWLLGM